MATTPTISTFQRNPYVAYSKIISDQCHPVLLFGSAGEDMTVKFQSVIGLLLNVSDSFPKIIGKIIGMCLGRRSHKRPRILLSLNSQKGQ